MSASKSKGTRGENLVVKALTEAGIPAERVPLSEYFPYRIDCDGNVFSPNKISPLSLVQNKNGRSKITEQQAKQIKYSSLSNVCLAEEFEISSTVVGYIKNGKNWTHV